MRATLALGLALLVAFALPPSGAVDTTGCVVRTSPNALAVGPFYVQGLGSYWEEANEVPGLQMRASGCDGRSIPADTCLFHVEGASVQVGCPLDALSGKAGGALP